MPDTIKLDIPKDAAVRVLIEDLRKMFDGLAAMGLWSRRIEDAIKKLNDQALEIERLTSDQAYIVGHRDGWHAAFATGLPGDEGGEALVEHMVSRFLTWKLPENFNPDGGISFKRFFNQDSALPMRFEPSGTNLLDHSQAKAMVLHMIDGLAGKGEAS